MARNLTDPRVIWMKGVLFLLLGMMAASLLLIQLPTLKTALLLAIVIWSFCRAYYFAFYVIEHYVDPTFRFAGLIDFVRFALIGKRPDKQDRIE